MRNRSMQLVLATTLVALVVVTSAGCTSVSEAMPSGYSVPEDDPNAIGVRVCFHATETFHKAEVVHESEESVTISVKVRRTGDDSIAICAPNEWIRLELSERLGDRRLLNYLGDPITNLDEQRPLCETVPAVRC